jgi:hypothetical protein
MTIHYNNMKEKIGLKEIFEATDSDEETEKVLFYYIICCRYFKN